MINRAISTNPPRFTPRVLLGVGLFLLALVLPLVLPLFKVTVMTNIMIFSIVAIALVLLTGVIGLTSFGHAAFMGVGAYATAIITTKYGLSPWIGLPVGLLLGFPLGLGVVGIWVGLAAGLVAVAALMLRRWRRTAASLSP